jgi:DNA-binding GntR family transcriptional regulator
MIFAVYIKYILNMAGTMTKRGSKERKSDVAYQRLRSAIIRAEMAPGSAVDEAALMSRLKVGRTPVREALLRLVHEDLVMVAPQRGYFVSSTSASDFFHLNEFRLESEVLACRLAAIRITEAGRADFRKLLAEAREGLSVGRNEHDWHLGIDERMHLITAEAAGNPYLAHTLKRLFALSVRSLYVSRIPITLVQDEIENYTSLYEALVAHDPDKAEAVMTKHLDWSVVQVLRPMSPGKHADRNLSPAGGN